MPRLRRTSTAQPGWTRRRAGRGFVYLDSNGQRLGPEDVARVKALAIPPAWKDVWICPWPQGHLQAVGTDEAGRRQYLYHEHWRKIRDRQKYERALEMAEHLPRARARVAEDLARPGMPRERALATAFRLLDVGALRIGGERYAEAHSSYGLATLRRDHVEVLPQAARIGFVGKAGREQEILVTDGDVRASLEILLSREDPGERLLAWQEEDGSWREVTSPDINAYIHDVTGLSVTAKDFRTWHGTALAAAVLADWASTNGSASVTGLGARRAGRSGTAGSAGKTRSAKAVVSARDRRATERRKALAARRKAVVAAANEVADHLGNTPTVARTSYIDPRVVERFLDGEPMPPPPGIGDGGFVGAMEEFEGTLRDWLSPGSSSSAEVRAS
jgi:DNA topoisomerase-1